MVRLLLLVLKEDGELHQTENRLANFERNARVSMPLQSLIRPEIHLARESRLCAQQTLCIRCKQGEQHRWSIMHTNSTLKPLHFPNTNRPPPEILCSCNAENQGLDFFLFQGASTRRTHRPIMRPIFNTGLIGRGRTKLQNRKTQNRTQRKRNRKNTKASKNRLLLEWSVGQRFSPKPGFLLSRAKFSKSFHKEKEQTNAVSKKCEST